MLEGVDLHGCTQNTGHQLTLIKDSLISAQHLLSDILFDCLNL